MNLRTALHWLFDKRRIAGLNQKDLFNQPDPESFEDLVDWLTGNDDVLDDRAQQQRREAILAAGGEIG